MSEDTGESKTEDATGFRLRKMREKGQIPRSRIFVRLAIYVSGVFIAYFLYSVFFESLYDSIKITSTYMSRSSIILDMNAIYTITIGVFLVIVVFMIALVSIGLISHIIYSKGLLIAPDLIVPKFSRISPSSNVKNIFGASQITENLIGIFKCCLWAAYAFLVLYYFYANLFATLQCGLECIPQVFTTIFIFLIGGSLVFAIVSMLIDVPLQKIFFLQNQKTTLSQNKRDRKETSGSPEIKRELRKQMRKLYSSDSYGVKPPKQDNSAKEKVDDSKNARSTHDFSKIMTEHKALCKDSYLIVGANSAVGIRFSFTDQYPVPVIVAASPQRGVGKLESEAKRLNIPILKDQPFADNLGHNHAVGSVLPDQYFQDLGKVFRDSGLFK